MILSKNKGKNTEGSFKIDFSKVFLDNSFGQANNKSRHAAVKILHITNTDKSGTGVAPLIYFDNKIKYFSRVTVSLDFS